MQIEITSKSKQPLYARQKLEFVISESKTPKKEDVRKKIAALQNASEDMVIIEKITNKFGHKSFVGTARIYDSRKSLEKLEPQHIVERNFGKKEAGKPAAPEAAKQGKK